MANNTPTHNANLVPRKRYPTTGFHAYEGPLRAAGFTVEQSKAIVDLLRTIMDRQTADEFNNYDVIERRMNSEIAPFGTTSPTTLPTTLSRKYRVRFGGELYRVYGDLNTAGTSDTVVTIYLNGVSIGTITIASGATSNTEANAKFSKRVIKGDIITVQVTTAGTGAGGLGVEGWIRR